MHERDKKPTINGRKHAAVKADARATAERGPPEARHDWSGAVALVTADEAKRAALLVELASMDEVEHELRAQVLAGSSTAGRVWIGIKQQRAKLLGLYAAPEQPKLRPVETPDSEIDVPDWVPVVSQRPNHDDIDGHLADVDGDGADDAH